ncbi:hypothetical protein BC833DRAFT_617066 [Globomyces pollinis-pini]|nr:hypothetical protein BC833DRAFT_617066 [Globomyces pollinis-pini]
MSLDKAKAAFQKRMTSQPVIQKKHIKVEDQMELPVAKSAPIFYSNLNISISRQLFEIITLLKDEKGPIDNNEIIRKRAIDILNTPELFEACKTNDRIIYDPINQTFQFEPTYNIRTKEDLLSLLKRNRGISGMEVKDLRESYTGVDALIEELVAVGAVLVVRNHRDNSLKLVYYNDTTYNVSISDEYKHYWHDIFFPTTLDLPAELRKVGLKPMQVEETKTKIISGKTKKAKRKTRVKMTNVHLEGVDLTKDYNPTNPT